MNLLSVQLLCVSFGGIAPVPFARADLMIDVVPPVAVQDLHGQVRNRPVALALNPRAVKAPPPLYDSEERQRRKNREYRRHRSPRDRDYDYDPGQDPSRRSRSRHQREAGRSKQARDLDRDHNRFGHRDRAGQQHRSATYHEEGSKTPVHRRRHLEGGRDASRQPSSRTQARSGSQYEKARYQPPSQTRRSRASTSTQRVSKTQETSSNEGPQHLLELGFGPFGHWWGAEISYLYHLRGGSVGPAVGAIISGSSAPAVKSFSVGGKFQWDFDLFPNQSLKFYAGPFAGHSFQWESSMRSDIGATLRMVVQERWTLFVQPVALSVFTYLGKGPVQDRVWPAYHGAAGIGVVF